MKVFQKNQLITVVSQYKPQLYILLSHYLVNSQISTFNFFLPQTDKRAFFDFDLEETLWVSKNNPSTFLNWNIPVCHIIRSRYMVIPWNKNTWVLSFSYFIDKCKSTVFQIVQILFMISNSVASIFFADKIWL